MSIWKKIKYKLLTKGFGAYINSMHFVNARFAAQIAYTLFSTPRHGFLKSIPTFLTSSAMKKLTWKDHIIQTYEWNGTKETILLIHGWESNANRWKGVIETLRKHNYCIIALDAPGQGLSNGKEFNAIYYSEFIHEVCQHFQPDYLVGHSLGGMTMFYYLSKYQPAHVKKALSLGAPNRFLRITDDYKRLVSMREASYREFLKEFTQRFDINPTTFNTEDFIDQLLKELIIGLIHDEKDKVVPYEDALEIKARHPHLPLHTTYNLGHSLYHTSVNKQIVHFLENNSFKL